MERNILLQTTLTEPLSGRGLKMVSLVLRPACTKFEREGNSTKGTRLSGLISQLNKKM